MRKFIFSSAMLGVLAGGLNILHATRTEKRDWRLILMWIGWVLSVAVAVGTVIEDADERQIEH